MAAKASVMSWIDHRVAWPMLVVHQLDDDDVRKSSSAAFAGMGSTEEEIREIQSRHRGPRVECLERGV